ncbi:hypothetical protein AAHA92_32895 [Salvia divinorum]|uniref:Uncharacterized protein n=1 Tax=Salvia divinorum TaxID=28513 RepID=A0ABD1FPU0_SALDI
MARTSEGLRLWLYINDPIEAYHNEFVDGIPEIPKREPRLGETREAERKRRKCTASQSQPQPNQYIITAVIGVEYLTCGNFLNKRG